MGTCGDDNSGRQKEGIVAHVPAGSSSLGVLVMIKSALAARMSADAANCGFSALHAPHQLLWMTSMMGLPDAAAASLASRHGTHAYFSPNPLPRSLSAAATASPAAATSSAARAMRPVADVVVVVVGAILRGVCGCGRVVTWQ